MVDQDYDHFDKRLRGVEYKIDTLRGCDPQTLKDKRTLQDRMTEAQVRLIEAQAAEVEERIAASKAYRESAFSVGMQAQNAQLNSAGQSGSISTTSLASQTKMSSDTLSAVAKGTGGTGSNGCTSLELTSFGNSGLYTSKADCAKDAALAASKEPCLGWLVLAESVYDYSNNGLQAAMGVQRPQTTQWRYTLLKR